MFLIITRNFPPDIGGMQNLMHGLTKSLSKLNLVKVFADYHENYSNFDDNVNFSIERVGGPKLLRKYRKSYLINEFLKNNKNVSCIIADHWKSLELINTNKKKICLIHSKEINHEKGTRQNKRLIKILNNVDYVISNSVFTKNLAINKGVNENRIIVINPGVEAVSEISDKDIEMMVKNFEINTTEAIEISRSKGVREFYLISLFSKEDFSNNFKSYKFHLYDSFLNKIRTKYSDYVKIIDLTYNLSSKNKEIFLCDGIHQKLEGNIYQATKINNFLLNNSNFFK